MTLLLERAASAPHTAAEDLLAGCTALVVVAPHPDDETLGCGTLLHAALARRMNCKVICLTDGSASHPGSSLFPPDRLAALRAGELRTALDSLARDGDGTIDCVPPRWRDCALPLAPGAQFDAATEWLAEQWPMGAMVFCSWCGDPHVDHERAAALCAAAAAIRTDVALWHYPIWGRFERAPPCLPLVQLTAGPDAIAAKRAALACHASQMGPLIPDDPDGFVMSQEHQQHFLDREEIFIAPS